MITKYHLNRDSKKIKGYHVEQKMEVVLVNKTGSQKPVVLPLVINPVRVHHILSKKCRLVPCVETGSNRNSNNDIGNHEAGLKRARYAIRYF